MSAVSKFSELMLLFNKSAHSSPWLLIRRYHHVQIIRKQNHKKLLIVLKRSSYSTQSSLSRSGIARNVLKYSLAIALGTTAGLLTGYYLMLDQFKLVYDDPNQASRTFLPDGQYQATRFIEYADSIYRDWPLKIHVYQYESCPYCSQIRTYLDYFGISYQVTEVNAYDKTDSLGSFTKARLLPIVVIEDRVSCKRWHLVNATAILSALESLRNEKQHINYEKIIEHFLPVIKQSMPNNLAKHPNKYIILNESDLNSIEWRKWINNEAIPAFKLNSIATFKDLRETFDYYAEKSGWKLQFSRPKFLYVYYKKMYAANNLKSALMKSLEHVSSNKAPREILNDIIGKWEAGLGQNQFISGTNKPNLADLAMFGNVKAFEGCALFRESIGKHALFRAWYERMQFVVTKRYQHDLPPKQEAKPTLFFPLISLDASEAALIVRESNEAAKTMSLRTLKFDLSQAQVFRILTVTYLVHVLVFTYAAWMSR